MITDKIDEYLNRKKSKYIKEDIDSLDVTDSVIRLIESLSDEQLDDEQLELKDRILELLDRSIENMEEPAVEASSESFSELGLGADPFEEEFSEIQDPESTEPFEMGTEKVYADHTIWTKKLSEGKKKPVTTKKSAKKPEKNINKSKKK